MIRIFPLLLLSACTFGRNTLPPCSVVVTVVDEAGDEIPDATATLADGTNCLEGCSFFEEDPDESMTVEAAGYESETLDIGFGDCATQEALEVVLVEVTAG